jgi:hypothetical protein
MVVITEPGFEPKQNWIWILDLLFLTQHGWHWASHSHTLSSFISKAGILSKCCDLMCSPELCVRNLILKVIWEIVRIRWSHEFRTTSDCINGFMGRGREAMGCPVLPWGSAQSLSARRYSVDVVPWSWTFQPLEL